MGRLPKSHLPQKLSSALKVIGANVRVLREESGLSQVELAQKAQISATTLNGIESKSDRDVRVSTLVALSEVLDVSLIEFFVETDLEISSSDKDQLLQASDLIQRLVRKASK